MERPDDNNILLRCISSSSVKPSGGYGNNADAPPEIQKINKSFSLSFLASVTKYFDASKPADDGTGWDALNTLKPKSSHSLRVFLRLYQLQQRIAFLVVF